MLGSCLEQRSAQFTLFNAKQPAVSTFLILIANIAALPCHHAWPACRWNQILLRLRKDICVHV